MGHFVELIPISSDVTNYYDHLNHVWTRKRRKDQGQGQISLIKSRSSVPCWTYPPFAPKGKLCRTCWCRCPRLLGCRHGVFGLKSLSWPAMLLVTTKKLVSFQDIFNW